MTRISLVILLHFSLPSYIFPPKIVRVCLIIRIVASYRNSSHVFWYPTVETVKVKATYSFNCIYLHTHHLICSRVCCQNVYYNYYSNSHMGSFLYVCICVWVYFASHKEYQQTVWTKLLFFGEKIYNTNNMGQKELVCEKMALFIDNHIGRRQHSTLLVTTRKTIIYLSRKARYFCPWKF